MLIHNYVQSISLKTQPTRSRLRRKANRKALSGYREDLLEQGYTPCGNCEP